MAGCNGKNESDETAESIDLLVARVAELADALDSGSFHISWTPLDLLDIQRTSLDKLFFKKDLFGLFWPCFYARGVQYGVQWLNWAFKTGSSAFANSNAPTVIHPHDLAGFQIQHPCKTFFADPHRFRPRPAYGD
jgi:hypothetical protein